MRRATFAWCAPLSQHSRKLTANVDVQPVHMLLALLGTKKLLALASDEKLRVERRARKLGWWKPQQHVPCEKDDE